MNISHKFDCSRVFKNYDMTCNRCIELANGAKPREGWQKAYYENKARQEAITSRAITQHYTTDGGRADCKKNCGVVCTRFEW